MEQKMGRWDYSPFSANARAGEGRGGEGRENTATLQPLVET